MNLFAKPITPKYGHKKNVIKISENVYAVRKYLLPPKYYDPKPLANESQRQVVVREVSYVLFHIEEIASDICEFLKPHIMDDYEYPMDGGVFPSYPNPNRKPYPQQIHVARWLLGNDGKGHPVNNGRGNNIFSSMRTGKSISCLWAAIKGWEVGIFKKILIVSPKTLVYSTWAKELSMNFINIAYTIKMGSTKSKSKISNTPIDIIGIDSLTALLKQDKIDKFTLIIYDEATALKNTESLRWKYFFKWFNRLHEEKGTRLWSLTGTPLAQSPMDAFGLAKLINPNGVPTNKYHWKNLTQYRYWGHVYQNKPECVDICNKALQPSIRFEMKDITDIPDLSYEYIKVEKSKPQAIMFKQLAKEFIITLDDESEIQGMHAAQKANKLLQILSGCLYDEERNVIDINCEPRLEAVCDLIDQLPEDQGIVIFTEWIHTQEMLGRYLKPKYKTVETISGQTSLKDRLDIEQRFQKKEVKVIVAHPATCARGLDLSSTNIILWYSPTYVGEYFQQGNERIRNIISVAKGFNKFTIYMMVADPMEEIIFCSQKDKVLTQTQLFNLIRQSLKDEFII